MNTENLLIELGTEELPPKALKGLGLAFRDGITRELDQRELGYDTVQWFASPRRLAILVRDLQLQAADKAVEVLGPPTDRARNEAGEWTPAALGFAKKQGVTPEQLEEIETPKGTRLGLRSVAVGVTVKACLNAIIHQSIQQLPIPKKMRWGASRTEFVRPVQWIVAMLGQDSEHGKILDVETANITWGHRFHSAGPVPLQRPEDYEDTLLAAKVVANYELRQKMIRDQVEVEASALNATAVIDQQLLDEVTGLVEWPVALTGSFEQRFLDVPAEALISSMKEHQKYFHLVNDQGELIPNFITVANIESTDWSQVIAGNERVIRPRLSDAAFFFETDKKTTLESRLTKLERVVFAKKLGTVGAKSQRVEQLAGALAERIGSPVDKARRAAALSKADLVSDMVLEFADMQGVAGQYYALNDGEDEEVAAALAQQYWPKFAGDKLPVSGTACAVALADRLDTLCGIFGIGQAPTGSKDPFALRRASLAVLRIIVDKNLDLDLRECLQLAISQYPPGLLDEQTCDQVFTYMVDRFRAWFEAEDIPVEVFKAVSAKQISRPVDIQRRVHAVYAFSQLAEASALAAANKRVSNILSKLEPDHAFGKVDNSLLIEPQEQALAAMLEQLADSYQRHLDNSAYQEALASLASLRQPVDAFFDGVMVNAEDQHLRANRLNLLKGLRDMFLQVADISQLVVAK